MCKTSTDVGTLIPCTFPLILQLGETLNRQFEAVCGTMFGEVESQAVEALDLPGVFRTRSHSYVRAIQAGCSQDDDCLSVFSMSGPQGSIKGGAGECAVWVHQYAKVWGVSVERLDAQLPFMWQQRGRRHSGRWNFMTGCVHLRWQKQIHAHTCTHTRCTAASIFNIQPFLVFAILSTSNELFFTPLLCVCAYICML